MPFFHGKLAAHFGPVILDEMDVTVPAVLEWQCLGCAQAGEIRVAVRSREMCNAKEWTYLHDLVTKDHQALASKRLGQGYRQPVTWTVRNNVGSKSMKTIEKRDDLFSANRNISNLPAPWRASWCERMSPYLVARQMRDER